MRVAIIHYWLVGMRGGEKVLEALCRLYPQADLYTHVVDPARISQRLRDHVIDTTFIARLPGARRHYQKYLPLMPLALEQLDLRGYDLVLSSEAGPAKGVLAAPGARHVCYCHSPMRYIWDEYPEYARSVPAVLRPLMAGVAHRMRQWDVTSAARVDRFIANSSFVRDRIARYWRREASVLPPPVAVERFSPAEKARQGYYLLAGQLVPYKRPDLAVAACTALGRRLVVAGTGPERRRLEALAGPSIEFRGFVPDEELPQLYAGADALLFPGCEDFGIVPVESLASGTPVVAYGRGGICDTVEPGVTGLYHHEQTVESLIEAIRQFETLGPFRPDQLVRSAAQFETRRFEITFRQIVDSVLSQPAMAAEHGYPLEAAHASQPADTGGRAGSASTRTVS